jgi:acyl-CoA thioester hydrolase
VSDADVPAPDVPDARPARSAYEIVRRVAAADLDAQAEPPHVNNLVYVRWVQDAAVAHWEALTSAATRAAVAWVLLRHEIDYRRPAVLGDEVVVRTAVGHLEGLTFERHTEVRRARDGVVLARSRTLWCPIDPRTGRPRRVGDDLRALFAMPPHGAGAAAGAPPTGAA